jgi:CheY-like chemotaxis protein
MGEVNNHSAKSTLFLHRGKIPVDRPFSNSEFCYRFKFKCFMKVLVVHRLEEQIKDLKSRFRHWHVQTANTGLDGLLAARIESYDLIVCCLQLPVVTGIEVMRSIRNFPLNQKTPIVVLADGPVSADHIRLLAKLDVNLLTLKELEEMNQLPHHLK